MPKRGFSREYFEEHYEEEERLKGQSRGQRGFITPGEISADDTAVSEETEENDVEEGGEQEMGQRGEIRNEDGKDIDDEEWLRASQQLWRQSGEGQTNIAKEKTKAEASEERPLKNGAEARFETLVDKPQHGTTWREQSTRERESAFYDKTSKKGSRRNLGRKPKYKDQRG